MAPAPDRTAADLARLELLSEVDALMARLSRWADAAPEWQPAESCRALVGRLTERAEQLAVRMEAPLVVATLGGTGTGKSALVNAIVGDEVVPTGRERPTTTRPKLICRSDLKPKMLGIDPRSVDVVHHDSPALSDLVLIDCPDPDTTEEAPDADASTEPAGKRAAQPSNLARLRAILPHCDVLLITTTQQKYRSARVADELAAAAPGARLVFVQTHADTDDDVRSDWAAVLGGAYATGRMFFVDSLAALDDARQGLHPRGEFGQLLGLLAGELSGTAGARIRRANFLDLVDAALARCRKLLDEAMPPVDKLVAVIEEQRTQLAAALAAETREELLASRRAWDNRLLGKAALRWGLSPFAMVLRAYQGLGGILAGSLLWRMRTPAQMALWGTVQGVRRLKQGSETRAADRATARAVSGCFDETTLRKSALVLEGYAQDAGLPRATASARTAAAEAEGAGEQFVGRAAVELESVVTRLARRHTGWFTRAMHELALLAMLGFLLYRLGKNFFYDSLLAANPEPVYGLDFYVAAAFWLLLWCLLLVWLLTNKLRRGLRREIDQLAQSWNTPQVAAGLFAELEEAAGSARRFRQDLDVLCHHVATVRNEVSTPDEPLGHRR